LIDAPQYRCEPVKVVAGLVLPFVPPRGADLGQWLDQFAGLGGVTRAGATEEGSLDQIPTTDFPRRHRTDGRPPWVDHEEAIRNFLSLVEPETGYIE